MSKKTSFVKIKRQITNKVNKTTQSLKDSFYTKFPKLQPQDESSPANPIIVYGIIVITIVVLVVFTIPTIVTDNNLLDLGYSRLAIANIRSQGLVNKVKKNKLYSSTLNTNFENDIQMDSQYLPLYTFTSSLSDETILMYKRLVVLGYSQNDILEIFTSLKDYEITVLLTLPKQDDVTIYIDDCKNHSDNSRDSFTLSNTYYTPNDKATSNASLSDSVEMLVNKRNYLDSSYVPGDLNEVSVRYAASGVTLSQTCIDALVSMTEMYQSLQLSSGFYVSSGYRSYSDQDEVFQTYVSYYGDDANNHAAQAGFSEHQSGLAFDLATTSSGEFKDSTEFSWLTTNAADYGFILRYPENKEYITGINYEPWHYRYVGKEIAQAIVSSNMTYEEYYELYLRPLPENMDSLIQENQDNALKDTKKETTVSQEQSTIEPTVESSEASPTPTSESK